MMKRILIVGGANGIGLSMGMELASRVTTEKIFIIDKVPLTKDYLHENIESIEFDLTHEDYSLFDRFTDIDGLIITAGFGKLSLFRDVTDEYIRQSFAVNTLPVLRIIKKFYKHLESSEDFYCGVMVSIAGFMSSPFYAVYGATKAALKIFIESINIELEKAGSSNRILNVSPGSIKGTSFNSEKTNLNLTTDLAKEIITHIESKDDLFIPQYDEIFHQVLERYHKDFRAEGRHSYDYKLQSGRLGK